MDEGYIKFNISFENREIPDYSVFDSLNKLRSRLFKLKLIGVYPDGIGYGNVSTRLDDSDKFLITGSSTGVFPELFKEHYSVVEEFDILRNFVKCHGCIAASSESMTHGAVYKADKSTNCVAHIHSKELFRILQDTQDAFLTPQDALFGTPAMAMSIHGIVSNNTGGGIVVMTGHPEGIIFYGKSVDVVYRLIRETVALV